ncbi:hypothetical protein NFI96_028500 [Prochilodus magdalenae]|nr:hypothetical protein NFI96_028500 [Prochilodus magdalenae]
MPGGAEKATAESNQENQHLHRHVRAVLRTLHHHEFGLSLLMMVIEQELVSENNNSQSVLRLGKLVYCCQLYQLGTGSAVIPEMAGKGTQPRSELNRYGSIALSPGKPSRREAEC